MIFYDQTHKTTSTYSYISMQQAAYAVERKLAIDAAKTAARLCEQVRCQLQTPNPTARMMTTTKSDRSPVTVADFGAQAIICRAIQEKFPNDPIVAEEDATELSRTSNNSNNAMLDEVTTYVQDTLQNKGSQDAATQITATQVADWIDRGNSTGLSCDRFWTLDPIDGTKGFLRDRGQYAVALSLIERGNVKVGVLACPAFRVEGENSTGWLFVAVQGQGAFRISLADDSVGEGKEDKEIPIQVCDSSNNEHHTLRFVESVEAAHGDQTRQGEIAKAVGITSPENSLRMDSQAKYAAIATGSAALYLRLPSPKQPNRRECIWDHAAGVIIVEEAGGKVTDLHGKKLDFMVGARLENNQGVVVSNAGLHDAVVEALR